MKKQFLLLAILLFGQMNFADGQSPDPVVQQLTQQTNLDSLLSFVEILSGKAFIMQGRSYTISSRHARAEGNKTAEQYLAQKLTQFGLKPQLQAYSAGGVNVLAEQKGTVYPQKRFIVCAHYDDMPKNDLAPGADDNASGVAAVLETARLLSHYSTQYTVVYAFWDEEEIGNCEGSLYYATQAKMNGEAIEGVVNLDMIAWDANNDNRIDIHTRNIANSTLLSKAVSENNRLYSIGLQPTIQNPGSDESDHYNFWDAGISAICLSEEYFTDDFNPYWHTAKDLVTRFNKAYFLRCSRLVVSSMAGWAGLHQSTLVAEPERTPARFVLMQNYPNPFNHSATIRFELAQPTSITLDIIDRLGKPVLSLLHEQQKEAGVHRLIINADHLASGVYFCRLIAEGGIQTRLMTIIN